MGTITGTIEKVSKKFPPKVGFCLNGKWYNTNESYLKESFVEGDVVAFEDKGKNFFNNPKKVSSGGGSSEASASSSSSYKPSGGRTFPVGALAPERTINRQNALTNAVAFHSKDDSPTVEDILATAKLFEDYTTGDDLLAEAQEAASKLGIQE